MPEAEYDLKAIMSAAYGTHHRLRHINGNRFQPTWHQLNHEDKAQHHSNYSSCSSLNGEPEINPQLCVHNFGQF